MQSDYSTKMSFTPSTLQLISECFIKPQHISDEAKQPIHLSPLDLSMLSLNYIQKGLLFPKPKPSPNEEHQDFTVTTFLQNLKDSLSTTLTHFSPLAGRLATRKQETPTPCYVIYLDPSSSPGAKFVHAVVDVTISDVLTPTDVPLIVQSFFDQGIKSSFVNHDGHFEPLLSVQVTELIDGIFILCSINHVVCDGMSFWHFFNTWSQVFRNTLSIPNKKSKSTIHSMSRPPVPNKESTIHSISHPPIHQRSIGNQFDQIVNLPFTHHDQFIRRQEHFPPLRERIFHFSSTSLLKLKEEANAQANTKSISTLQSLTAHVWRCITRARGPLLDQETKCSLAVNNRSRLDPPLSDNFVGNYMVTVNGTDLLKGDLGWAASLLNKAVANHNEETVREFVEGWLKSPTIVHLGMILNQSFVLVGSSPRFDIYGNEFGLGKALAVRSGKTNKSNGKVTLYPGVEGHGSMDMEICLTPETMAALESDHEFLDMLSI